MQSIDFNLFSMTFSNMQPSECLEIIGAGYMPQRNSTEVVSLNLQGLVPMEYVMNYGRGSLRENGSQPRPNALKLPKS